MASHEERVLCFWTALKDGTRFLIYWLPDVELLGATDLLDAVYEVAMDKRGRQRLLKNLALDMVESKWRRTFREKGFRLDASDASGGEGKQQLSVRYLGQSAQLAEVADRATRQKRNADLVNRLMEERDLLMAEVGRNGAAEGEAKVSASPKPDSPEATITATATAASVPSLQSKRRKRGKVTGAMFDEDNE